MTNGVTNFAGIVPTLPLPLPPSLFPTPLPHELLLCSESHALSLTSSLPPSHPLARMPALARVYAKKLSASDTAVHGSLSLPRKVALNCLPSLVSE